MLCADCKFAEWERTTTGRLSPNGRGQCTWVKTMRVAASAHVPFAGEARTRVTFKGGTIWRKDDPPIQCPVFEHAE